MTIKKGFGSLTAEQQSDRCPPIFRKVPNLPDIPSFQTETLGAGGAAELSPPGGDAAPRAMAGQFHAGARGERAHRRGERRLPGAEAPQHLGIADMGVAGRIHLHRESARQAGAAGDLQLVEARAGHRAERDLDVQRAVAVLREIAVHRQNADGAAGKHHAVVGDIAINRAMPAQLAAVGNRNVATKLG
jgi:hypothetical protein